MEDILMVNYYIPCRFIITIQDISILLEGHYCAFSALLNVAIMCRLQRV